MSNWRKILARMAHDVESEFDDLKYRLAERLGREDPLLVLPYRGYGSRRRLYLKGRVLEDEGITLSTDNDSVWRNLLNTFRRLDSDEVPGARVRVRFQDAVEEVVADEEGFFEVWLEPSAPAPADRLWHEVELELLAPEGEDGRPVRATGRVLAPPPEASLAVISDIDDTVLQSHVTDLVRMARTVFLGNARTRLPFPGVAAFYRALQQGAAGDGRNPLFFLSSSPWNLYDLLVEFFELQEIPRAPLFLRDWGVTRSEILPTENRAHKMDVLHRLFDFYDDLPFILIGDSGQQDPEIYREVVEAYPGRVLAVYIRSVEEDDGRPAAVRKLAQEIQAAGSTLILAEDTLAMARHAAQEGWIGDEAIRQVAEEVAAAEEATDGLEAILGDEA